MSYNPFPEGAKSFPIHEGEHLLTPGYVTDIELRVPATMQGPKRKEMAKGSVFLTDQRIVFIASKREVEDLNESQRRYDGPPTLHSLTIPFSTIVTNEFKVPLFQNNYIVINFKPDPDALVPTLPDPGSEAAIETRLALGMGFSNNFWKRTEKERDAWLERKRNAECLPAYSPAGTSSAPAGPSSGNRSDAPSAPSYPANEKSGL